MLEDKWLIWRFKRGSSDALRRLYAKYEGYLLTRAAALLIDMADAEDAVHDVFVAFAQSRERIKLNGSLKGYLATCVLNRARDVIRARRRGKGVRLDEMPEPASGTDDRPDVSAMCDEESRGLHRALAGIPYEQREVVVLHVQDGMTFRQIADLQRVSINTVQGRYRYGLAKLRALLGGEEHNESGK